MSGRYDQQIVQALNNREEIADVLLSFMSDKGKHQRGLYEQAYRESFFPISVYSRFSGKDSTTIKHFDGISRITYICHETKAEDTVDILEERIAKLAWKVDWAMRWGQESVVFEPGGKDHASPGSSYDVASVISRAIFNRQPPIFQGYEFIGLQGGGGKMSGSKGDAVSPGVLLDIYEPELLKWLYARRDPMQPFDLSFGTEVNRQYEEFDAARRESATTDSSGPLHLSFAGSESPIWPESGNPPLSFRQAAALGQITQWDLEKLKTLISESELQVDFESLPQRVARAKTWVEQYNPDQAIALVDKPAPQFTDRLTDADRSNIIELRTFLQGSDNLSIKELEERVYSIPKDPSLTVKENAKLQREFFKAVYGVLLGRDTGPRLSTFLWAAPRDRVTDLLDQV
jgi:lysyl-tRNA synthetase class 1